MTNDPEDIRRDIEATRRDLSADVDALTDKVSPARVVERRVDSARGALSSVRDKVMGSASSTTSAAGEGLGSAQEAVRSGTSSVTAAASSAPQVARRQANGNPLAAGLIAFGAGWLVSSLLPPTEKEQRLASRAKETASEHAGPVTSALGEAAQQVQENLREPAQQAAASVSSTASDATTTVHEEARSAAGDVAGQAQQAKDTVREQAGS
jgi:hypothetical protein